MLVWRRYAARFASAEVKRETKSGVLFDSRQNAPRRLRTKSNTWRPRKGTPIQPRGGPREAFPQPGRGKVLIVGRKDF